MADDIDDKFYERADAHINLSNDQKRHADGGKVSASMLYGTARFNAWISAARHASGPDMAGDREATIAYFIREYRAMLEEHLDDYIANFETYMKPTR